MNEYEVKKAILETGRRCWLRGWVAANDGNISARVGDNEFLTTASGQSKGFLTADMILRVDRHGNVLEGRMRPSTELRMHLLVYEHRPDVGAVFHAHPPACTAHAVAGMPLSDCVLPEIVVTLGAVPLAEYGTPSTAEVPDSLLPYVRDHNAFLLQNHGALTLGKDVFDAYYRMESIEHFAHIHILARGLGHVNVLTPGQVEKLMAIRATYGLPGTAPACRTAGGASPPTGTGRETAMATSPQAGTGRETTPCAAENRAVGVRPVSSEPAVTPQPASLSEQELVDRVTSMILGRLGQA